MNPAATLLHTALGAWLEALGNAGVGLDPDGRAHLARLNGRSLVVAATIPDEAFTVRVTNGQLTVTATDDPRANVRVCGQIPTLLAALIDPDATLKGLTVDGDEAVLLEFRQFAANWHPRLPAAARDVLRTPFGNALQNAFELGTAFARSAAEAAQHSIADRAAGAYVAEQDVEPFLERLEALRLRVDRAEARMALRAAATAATPSAHDREP